MRTGPILPGSGVSTDPISTQGKYWSYIPRFRGEYWSHLYLGWVLILSPPGVSSGHIPPPGHGVSTGPISTRGGYWSYIHPAPEWVLGLTQPRVSTGRIFSRGEYWSYLHPGKYWSYLHLGWVLVVSPPGHGVSTAPISTWPQGVLVLSLTGPRVSTGHIFTWPQVSTSPISLRPRGEYWSYLPPAPGWVLFLCLQINCYC